MKEPVLYNKYMFVRYFTRFLKLEVLFYLIRPKQLLSGDNFLRKMKLHR